MKKILVFISVLFLFSACQFQNLPAGSPNSIQNPAQSGENTLAVNFNQPFQLKPGETAVLNQFTVKFNQVESDSRCPQGVQCIWQGEAKLNMLDKGFLVTTDQPVPVEISTLNPKINLGGDAGVGYFLELEDLKPFPQAGNTIKPQDYETTFKIIKEEGDN
jgi:hypothetical protein